MFFKKYEEFFKEEVKNIMAIDSPSGFTKNAIDFVYNLATSMGFETKKTNLGNVIVSVDGKNNEKEVALSAHIDTLGLMVRSINSDGTLKFSVIGSPLLPSLDGEYCKIHTRDNKVYTGTILSLSPAKHVFKDASTRERNADEMIIRIDEEVYEKADVEKLGIQTGDFICFDTKTEFTKSGFLKSRFIDDKACVIIQLTMLKMIKEENLVPDFKTHFCFSVHEEIGYGGSTLPKNISELLVIDMGCIGLDLSCREVDVSICAKDSSGPYDYEMTSKLVQLSKENNYSYALDIYPFYSSDANAMRFAGYDCKSALIGPGVQASHGMERTHMKGIENTLNLASKYIGII